MTTKNLNPLRISVIAISCLFSMFFFIHVMADTLVKVPEVTYGKVIGSSLSNKLYHSKINGQRVYYKCPKGYTRFSPTRKMNHQKACTKRRQGKNVYARAKSVGHFINNCPPSIKKKVRVKGKILKKTKTIKLTRVKNQCMGCPEDATIRGDQGCFKRQH
ncbi:MAG: hypothetical protein ACMZ63_03785 [Methylotenera sp.]|jgi:hypothetical protein